jgi:hypothetical protein
MAKKGGQYMARDQVVGGGQIVTLGYGKARIVRELKPEGLTLYDVAVIADVVHKTGPPLLSPGKPMLLVRMYYLRRYHTTPTYSG